MSELKSCLLVSDLQELQAEVEFSDLNLKTHEFGNEQNSRSPHRCWTFVSHQIHEFVDSSFGFVL